VGTSEGGPTGLCTSLRVLPVMDQKSTCASKGKHQVGEGEPRQLMNVEYV